MDSENVSLYFLFMFCIRPVSYTHLPFETTIEGDSYDQLMDIVKECQHVAVRAGAEKVSAYIKVVYQPEGQILTIDQKITKHR